MKTINTLLLLFIVLGLSNCTMLKRANHSAKISDALTEFVPPSIDTTVLVTLPLNTEVNLLVNEPTLPCIDHLFSNENKIFETLV